MQAPDDSWSRVKAVFDAVLNLPPGEREPMIDESALPPELLAELRSLLRHHD